MQGMQVATRENVERACMFMRGLKAEGPTNLLAGIMDAFAEEELEAVHLLVDGVPSVRR